MMQDGTSTSILSRAIDAIAEVKSDGRYFDAVDFRATRVGRQGVWSVARIKEYGPSFYIKIGLNRDDFAREHSGLLFAQKLAERCNWIIAPTILDVQPERGLIATKAVSGTRLSELLADALRIDKILSRGRIRRIEDLLRCLELLSRWMKAFSSLPYDPHAHFICHDHQFSVNRAVANLRRIRLSAEKWHKVSAKIATILSNIHCGDTDIQWGLVHGDLSPGNIMFNGNRICVLDFEDMGYGPIVRDPLWLAFLISRSLSRFCYLKKEEPLKIILPYACPSNMAAVYNIDFELMRLELAHRNRGATKSAFGRIFHSVEIIDCLNGLERLTALWSKDNAEV